MYFWAAISIGFIGSVHCLGMCGPILVAINNGKGRWWHDFLHHSGRLTSYMVFGTLAGMLGRTIDLMGYQQSFSILIGSLLVTAVVVRPVAKTFKRVESSMGRISIRFSGWIHQLGLGPTPIRFLLGSANGMLPCGLVYLGLAGAASTFTPWDGAFFMLLFGLSTLPALLLVSKLASGLTVKTRANFRKLIPLTMLIMGSLLLLRGMDLGVPYLSPKAQVESNEIEDCR
ncbi:MAG: sulfite exporter TauE/SafE family protein [Cryomorphaceae bacterium]